MTLLRERRNERGSILILTALSMVTLLGMIALVLDGSRMYEERNRLSSAADAAAKSAAFERRRDPSANLMAFANRELTLHGIDPTAASIVMTSPPTTGPFTGRSGYIEATVTRTSPTVFAAIVNVTSMQMTVRAIAGSTSSP
ncbi:MAG: pilus assembly protein TadG-related protein, partial [Vicinamibacterales bacterium]